MSASTFRAKSGTGENEVGDIQQVVHFSPTPQLAIGIWDIEADALEWGYVQQLLARGKCCKFSPPAF
jgi:hypothetical protein